MTANKRLMDDLMYKELSYKIVGCFYSVYNERGPGFKESVYHGADYKLGYIVNFGSEKLDIRRRVYDRARK